MYSSMWIFIHFLFIYVFILPQFVSLSSTWPQNTLSVDTALLGMWKKSAPLNTGRQCLFKQKELLNFLQIAGLLPFLSV